MNDLVFLYPHAYLMLRLLFLISVFVISTKWKFIVILTYISMIDDDVEYFYLLNLYLYVFFGEASIHIFCSFSKWIVSILLSFDFFFVFRQKFFVRYVICKYFIPFCTFTPPTPVNRVFCWTNVFKCDEVQLLSSFIYGSCF